MTVTDDEYDTLSTDIREIIGDQITSFKIRPCDKGPWSQFAEVQPISSTIVREIVCAMELLEDEGYVTSIRSDDGGEYDHRSIFINVHMTYKVHERMFGE